MNNNMNSNTDRDLALQLCLTTAKWLHSNPDSRSTPATSESQIVVDVPKLATWYSGLPDRLRSSIMASDSTILDCMGYGNFCFTVNSVMLSRVLATVAITSAAPMFDSVSARSDPNRSTYFC